jgi:hypothetical protein
MNINRLLRAFSLSIIFMAASHPVAAQSVTINGDERRIDPMAIPKRIEAFPLTAAQQEYAIEHSLLEQGDMTMHSIVSGHVMHAKDTTGKPGTVESAKPQLNRSTLGVQPDSEVSPPNPPSQGGPGPLYYDGGAIISIPVVIPVFWGFNASHGIPSAAKDPDGMVQYLLNFLDTLAGSSWLTTVNQYGTPAFPANQPPPTTLLAVTAPIFDDTTSPGATYNNNDVQSEVGRLVGTRIAESSSDIIVVVTPHGSTNTDMVNANACAAHYASEGFNWLTLNHNYAFVTLPYQPDFCGAYSVSSALDGVSIVAGHEIAETITNPYDDNTFDHPGWASSNGYEIGDICAWNNLQDTTFPSGQSFATQPLWSNAANACVQVSAAGPRFFSGAFKTANGHFLTAVNGGGFSGGGAALQTGSTQVGASQTFVMQTSLGPLLLPKQFTLKTVTGDFVTAVDGGGMGGPNDASSPIHTDASAIGSWEMFTVSAVPCATTQQEMDVLSNPATLSTYTFCANIQTADGHFVTALNGGGVGGLNNVPIHTNATQAGSWETFQFVY